MGRKRKFDIDFRKEFFLNSWAYVGLAWLIACILQIIAVALPYWGKATLPSEQQYSEGLWRHCYDGDCQLNTLSRNDPTNPGFQVQSLEIPGLVLIISMAAHWWMAMTREIRSVVQDWIFVVLGFLGDILILAGIAIYGRKTVFLGGAQAGIETITFHACFILACIVFIISTFATAGSIYLTVQHHIIRRPPWKYRP